MGVRFGTAFAQLELYEKEARLLRLRQCEHWRVCMVWTMSIGCVFATIEAVVLSMILSGPVRDLFSLSAPAIILMVFLWMDYVHLWAEKWWAKTKIKARAEPFKRSLSLWLYHKLLVWRQKFFRHAKDWAVFGGMTSITIILVSLIGVIAVSLCKPLNLTRLVIFWLLPVATFPFQETLSSFIRDAIDQLESYPDRSMPDLGEED